MKTIYVYICAALLLLLTGCQDDERTPRSSDDERVAVRFSTLDLDVAPISRATDTDFESGDAIGIFVVNRSETGTDQLAAAGNYADNHLYTFDGYEFTTDAEPIWQHASAPLDLVYYAVYPYRADMTPRFTFEVEQDQSIDGAYTDSDLCIEKLATTDINVQLQLAHAMTSIEVHLTGDELREAGFSEVSLVQVRDKAVVDLSQATVTATGDVSPYPVVADETYTSPDERIYRALIPPQQITAGSRFIKIVVDTDTFYVGLLKTKTLKSGRRIVVSYEVGRDSNGQVSINYAGEEETEQHPDSREN